MKRVTSGNGRQYIVQRYIRNQKDPREKASQPVNRKGIRFYDRLNNTEVVIKAIEQPVQR